MKDSTSSVTSVPSKTDALETDRLLLRPWREEDGVELQRLLSDAAVAGGRHLPPDRIARMAEASLRQWRVNGFGPWAAIEKASGRWIGRIGLAGLTYRGTRYWMDPEVPVVWYAIDRADWHAQRRGRR
jgi:RimJ/RimL family protein N-acetyltransferase